MSNTGQFLRLISLLFFLSGIPALTYQLVWQRALFRVFGVNIESVTIVVTAFMLGLGIGSLVGGWLSRHTRWPLLLLLAAIEGGIGLYGLFSLQIIDGMGGVAAGLSLPLAAVLNLALIMVPTLLMGATLPILVGYLVAVNRSVGAVVGHLYYVNTLGGGAGCLLSAVALFPFLGMQHSVWLAASGNFLLAVGALIAFTMSGGWRSAILGQAEVKTGSSRTQNDAADRPSAGTPQFRFSHVVVLAFLSGLISLSFEILFFRVVSFATANSAFAFALTLGTFLIGLAGGARDTSILCGKGRSKVEIHRWLVLRLFAAGAIGAVFLPLLSHTAFLGMGMLAIALGAIYLLARVWGAFLPYLAELGVPADKHAGEKAGQLVMANIVGSAVGAVVTGFVLLEYLSMSSLAELLAMCALVLAAIAAWQFGLLSRRSPVLMGALVGMIVAVPILHPYLTREVVISLLHKDLARLAPPLTHVVENRSGIIAVDTRKTVYGHGIYDGRYNVDPVNDTNGIFRPLATPLYHPLPRNVLFIGLSTGS